MIKSGRNKTRTAKTMLNPEQELIDALTPLLSIYHSLTTHRYSKHDSIHSTPHRDINNCITSIANCPRPPHTRYKPLGRITVWHKKHEVSTNLGSTIRHAATSANIRQYLTKKYNWDDSVSDKIDWSIHSNALDNLTSCQRKTMTQMIHEWMPVNGHPGQNNHINNQQCPTFKNKRETQEHFFSYQTSAQQWTETLCNALPPKTSNIYQSSIIELLQWTLTECSSSTQDLTITHLPTSFDTLITEQAKIGWHQVIKGRWTTEWVRILDKSSPGKGELLATTILTSIWRAVFQMWKERCDKIYGDSQATNNKTRTNLQPRVNALFALKNKLDHVDQQALAISPDSVQKMTTRSLQDWIVRTKSFV
jgi:hypothetical protein